MDSSVRPGLVIFDCDGVLVDSEPIANQALAELLSTHGLVLSPGEAEFHFKGLSGPDTVAKVRTDWGITLPLDFISRVEAVVWGLLEISLKPVPGVEQAISVVIRSGSALCVASSTPLDYVKRKLTITGLLSHFEDRLYSADEVPRGKPHPDVFLYAAAQMGVAPARCVVVEDSLPGVQGAVAAGMRVLGYASEGGGAALRTAGAEVFGDMADVPGLLGL